MYLSEIKLWNFRKYGTDEQFDILKPSLILKLNKGIEANYILSIYKSLITFFLVISEV